MSRFKRITLLLLALPIGVMAAEAPKPPEKPQDNIEQLKRGEYLTRAADCIACHTADKSRPFAGGYALATPLGTIFGSNISPDAETGIGSWSDDDFYRALHEGIRPDGKHLYPAMPYAAYTKLTREDVLAIKAYLFSQPPFHNVVKQSALSFPFNQRWGIAAWKALNFTPGEFAAAPMKDVAWNRGAYLVEGLAHCQECHTPRTLTMGVSKSKPFAGGQIGGWQAYNITSDPVSGIGGWSDDALLHYLQTGNAPGHGQAAGPMAEAIENSLRFISEPDLRAMIAYLRDVPPIHDSAESKARFSIGAPAMDEAELRGKAGISALNSATHPAELFSANCASCHTPSGAGSADGYYPSLLHNSTVGSRDPSNLIQVLLNGVSRNDGKQTVYMPGFANSLSDAQLAQLATYVSARFGTAQTITAQDIAKRRPTANNAPFFLQVGMAALVIVLIAVLALLLRPRRRKTTRIEVDL